jgi:hypothetical protein
MSKIVDLDDILEDCQRVVDVALGEAHGGLDADDILVDATFAGQDLPLHHLVEHFEHGLVVGLLGGPVLHELDSDHESLAPHVSNEPGLRLDPLEPGHQPLAHDFGPFLQFLLIDDPKILESNRAGDGVRPERAEELLAPERVRDLLGGDHCGQGVAISDALGHGHDIGGGAPLQAAPVVGAQPAEASLHLVSNADAMVLADGLIGGFEEIIRHGVDAARAHERLADEPCDPTVAGGSDTLLELTDIVGSLVRPLEVAAVFAREPDLLNALPLFSGAGPIPNVGDGDGRPVVAVAQGVKLVVPGGQPGKRHGRVVGLGARAHQEDPVEAGRAAFGQGLGVHHLGLAQVPGRGVDQLLRLLLVGGHDPGVAVARRDRGDAADQVQVAPALVVPEVLHLGLGY